MTTTAAILFWSSLCSAVSYLLAGSVVIGGTARGVTLKRAKSNGSKARSTISIVADGAGRRARDCRQLAEKVQTWAEGVYAECARQLAEDDPSKPP